MVLCVCTGNKKRQAAQPKSTPNNKHNKPPKPTEVEMLSNKPQHKQKNTQQKRKINEGTVMCIAGFAGQRARVPPDPIPNSEVKPRSVPNCSVVFGHVNLGKLAAYLNT